MASLLLGAVLLGCPAAPPAGDARGGEWSALPDLGAGEPGVRPDLTDGARREAGATDAQPPSPDTAPPLRDDALPDWTWHDQSLRLVDKNLLGAAFAAAGYTPPSGTHLLAVEVRAGLGQPAFRYASLGATATAYSAGVYWPASTVKLTAAVAALATLESYGLTGAASVSFTDDDGSFAGTVKSLYAKALEVSDNVAYNRLMELAGFDEVNEQLLTPARSLPKSVLQRRYTHPLPTSNLRTSPPVTYSEGSLTGTIPKRVGVSQHPECPNEGNCVTLLELLDVLRRVVLHDELPAADRFPLAAADVAGLKASLLVAPTALEPGASQALGHPVQVYNKTGEVYGDDRLDHGLVVDTVSGARYLLAISMPYNTTSAAAVSELARQSLTALSAASGSGVALQRSAGLPITVQLDDGGPGKTAGTRAYTLTIAAPGASGLELSMDGYLLPKPTGPAPTFKLQHDFSTSGERLLVVRALAAGALAGYRALRVKLN
jgi:beta-lactamase class A